MAESDNLARLVTGRQSAHLEIVPRQTTDRATQDEQRRSREKLDVSVVEWEVREEVCTPYTIKALISTPGPVSRKDMLGQWARFQFQTEEGSPVREFRGVITRFHSVSRSADGCTYRVVIRQRLALVDGPSFCATYQNKTSPEIIQEVIERNDLKPWIRVVMRLRRQHPRHAFRFQFNMGDWDYCRLEMEQAGLFCFTENDKHGEVLVIADDIDGYTRPAIELKERPGGGLHTFEESVYSLNIRTQAVPDSFIVADYNPDKAVTLYREEGRARNEFSAEDDNTMLGKPYVWGTHHEDEAGAKREAVLRHEAARSQQVTCKAKSTMPTVRPGCIVRPDSLEAYAAEEEPGLETKEGVFVFRVVHRGARNQNYRNTFRAIPAGRPYRMPIDESKWPRVHTLGFTVTSPDKYTYPYLDREGRIIVRFHCDFGNWPKGGESVPLRMAKPFSSKDRSGLNMPPVDGDHGIAGFYDGNPNKPFALAFLPNSVNPDLINSSRRRISRSEIRTRGGNKMWMDDWEGQRGIELSTEEAGRSQLNLGFIPDGDLKERGRGAELRTGDRLVGRGGAGVMVTAYNHGGGSGKVLAMDETDAQLKDHQELSKSLAESAEASRATPADTDAQKAINDGLRELKKPGVLVTGPGPVGIASGDGVHVASDGSLVATTKKGMHFSTFNRFTVAARDWVSLFSQKGMNLITATGDFVAQAQRGRMQLASQGDMTVETVDGVLHVKSPKEIVLNAGGSYIRIAPGGIEFGSRGGAVFKTSSLKKTGPAQMDLGGAAFAPQFVPFTTGCEVWRKNANFIQDVADKPAPAPAQWQGLVNTGAVPPARDAGSMAAASNGVSSDAGNPWGAGAPQTGRNTLVQNGRGVLTVNDPENAPTRGAAGNPDPIKLESPASCNWLLSDFVAFATMQRETPTYQKYGWTRTERLVKDGSPVMCAGTAPTTCQFTYDSSAKTLTAKVVTALVPRLLVKMNPATRGPLRDEHNNYVVVQYETFGNGANSGKSFAEHGLMLVERDPGEVDASKYKNMIEKTLNQGNYRLILAGCSKGASCGCRVAVKFCADVHVVREADAPALNPNITINLYPTTERADAANWPESEFEKDARTGRYTEKITQTKAHETGHLFNFPDEYWQQGGFVHSMYVKDGRDIDFALADANRTANRVWVIETENNLMGDGCIKPTATTSPYYLEYIRRWFSEYTNKMWRVGYHAPAGSAKSGGNSAEKTGAVHATK